MTDFLEKIPLGFDRCVGVMQMKWGGMGGQQHSAWKEQHEKRHRGKKHHCEFWETTVLLKQKLCRR